MLASLPQAALFTRIVEGFALVAPDLVFCSQDSELNIQAIDTSSVALVQARLFLTGMHRYVCDKPERYVLSSSYLRKCVHMLDDDMLLDIDMRSIDRMRVEGTVGSKCVEFEARLQESNESHEWIDVEGAHSSETSQATIATGHLLPQLQNLSHMGSDLTIEITKEALKLSVRDDRNVDSTVSFPSSVAQVEVGAHAPMTVSLAVVKKFLPVLKVAPHVTVFTTPAMPVEFQINIPSVIRVRMFVAPKMN